MNLGELFIQLAFQGDTKEADKFIKKTKKIIEQTEKEIKKNQLLIKYLKDLKNAESEAEKSLIKKQFKNNINLINEKSALKEVSEKQNNNKKSIKKTITAIAGYITAISGAIYAVNRLTESLINQNQQWLNLTRTSTVALSTYQKWNAIGKMFGIDNSAQQIKNLNDRLFELKLTGANAQGFMLAGINPTNADDVMEQLRNRIKGLNDNAASYLLKQMGLDENMLHILRMERSEFEKLNNEIKEFQLTDKQRKSIQQMNVQLQIASQQIQYLKDRAILAILPAWVKFIKLIAKLGTILGKAFKYIKNNIKTIAATLAVFSLKFIPFVKIIKAVPGILQNIVKFFPAIKGFLLRVGALLWRTFLPLTALYLLFDDIFTYLEGGDSVTGDVIKAMKEFQEKGFFSDNVPKWIQLLATAADKLYYVYTKQWEKNAKDNKEMKENRGINVVPTDKQTIEDLNALKEQVTNPQRLKAIENAIKGIKTMNNPFLTVRDRYADLERFTINDILRENNKNITNTNNNQTTIHQQNNINSSETAKDILNSILPFTNAAFSGGSI